MCSSVEFTCIGGKFTGAGGEFAATRAPGCEHLHALVGGVHLHWGGVHRRGGWTQGLLGVDSSAHRGRFGGAPAGR
eukprot:1196113-Prorocentrum_minimum.AAC.1